MFSIVSAAILTTIYGLPALVLGLSLWAIPAPYALIVTAAVVPLAYPTLFALTAAAISRPFQHAIVPGRFPRDLGHPVYRARRIYGLCWTCVYYNKPLYAVILALPWLRTLTFRGFGYRGQMDFTIYPDTWIRDLPLLDFGPRAYIANRATLGTNMALSNGTSFVDRITIGEAATVGHLGVVGPGAEIGDRAEIGARANVGIGAKIGRRSNLQPCCMVNHAARVGAGATIGSGAYVGAAAVIDDESHLEPCGVVQNRGRYPRAARDAAATGSG